MDYYEKTIQQKIDQLWDVLVKETRAKRIGKMGNKKCDQARLELEQAIRDAIEAAEDRYREYR